MKETTQHPCQTIVEALTRDGLFAASHEPDPDRPTPTPPQVKEWRITCTPYMLSQEDVEFLSSLGNHLLAFNQALNKLYFESNNHRQPPWVADLLDQGKPPALTVQARMKRFRKDLPGIIRPDIIPTEEGMIITELDSVPGGIGLTGSMSQAYAPSLPPGVELIGGANGMIREFGAMFQELRGERVGCIAIVVSEESKDYLPEMQWVVQELQREGIETVCADPKDIRFTEEGLIYTGDGGPLPIAVVYRFYELFDLMNIPKTELTAYSAKKNRVTITPPLKPHLEEKMAFALFHHPVLKRFWEQELGETTYPLLKKVFPHTWILDPHPLPPSAIIPDLCLGQQPVTDWRELAQASQKDRHYVVKPSGFSELAWGSRGVSVGHDLSQQEWADVLDKALASFPTTPYILQKFHKGRQVEMFYFDAQREDMAPMAGRTRLSPYYFVHHGEARLAGVLATVCSLEKKIIHGMRDAIMAPCAKISV